MPDRITKSCEELDSTDIGNVRQEELLKIMKEPHQDYFSLLAMNSSSNGAKCLFGDVGIDLGSHSLAVTKRGQKDTTFSNEI